MYFECDPYEMHVKLWGNVRCVKDFDCDKQSLMLKLS